MEFHKTVQQINELLQNDAVQNEMRVYTIWQSQNVLKKNVI